MPTWAWVITGFASAAFLAFLVVFIATLFGLVKATKEVDKFIDEPLSSREKRIEKMFNNGIYG